MRVIIQRVLKSSVEVDGEIVGAIGKGFNILLGVSDADNDADLEYLVNKIVKLRIFADEQGKINLSIKDVGGSILVISQFTLYADCRKGNRPSFIGAGRPEYADMMYEKFKSMLRNEGINVESGRFGADMKVEIINDGPVTIYMDSTEMRNR